MPADTILVIDAGTSALRAIAVRADGRVTPISSEPWPMFVPDDASPFGREFDAKAIERSLARLVAAAAPLRSCIAGITFVGQREGLACIDDGGAAVFVSPNIDARASAEGMAVDAARAADVYAVTGHLPSLMQAPAKLAWLRAHRPAVSARIAQILPLSDWLAMLMTTSPRISRSLAAENGMLDVTTGDIARDLLHRLDVSLVLVPPVVPDGSIAGDVMAGDLVGLPVVLAGADTQCALVGMGATEPGAAGIAAGWSTPVQLVTARPILDGDRRTWTGVHVVPDRWILESNAGELGRAFDWICTMMEITAAQADALATTAPVGSGDAMAVLGPRVMRASAMNAGIGGITMPLPLVMSAPDRGHVLRAVLEATAYAVRANLEQIEQISGFPAGSIAIGGGMSRSALFTQIVADVLDRRVETASAAETSALGAAALASARVGVHPSLAEALCGITGGRRTVDPNPRASADYDDHYARWCEMTEQFEGMAGA